MTVPNLPGVPSPMSPPPLWRQIIGFPSTRWGSWSVYLAIAFILLLGIFYALVASGQKGGATFFSNPLLAFSVLLAAVAALVGGATASTAIVWKRERSLLVFVVLLLGLFVLVFVLGEIAGHH